MIPDLTRGTKETLIVDLEDVLGSMNTLAGTGALFDVKTKSGTPMITDGVVAFNGGKPMEALCLVDTNVPILWPAAKYYLYLKFAFATDAPVLGGMEFHVNP